MLRKTLIGYSLTILLVISAIPAKSQLLLNEFMASNANTLEDQFQDYPDWIEIYNSSDQGISLGDYFLSDELDSLFKWKLPDAVLPPDSYMIVFASGKDVRTNLSYWHTIINIGEQWKYLVPQAPVDEEWKTSVSYTSDWSTGKSGFGYGDDDDSTVLAGALSVYIQKEFDIPSFEKVSDAALYMDYDDGFVAYLNGVEIARSPSMGTAGQDVNYDTPADFGNEAFLYKGLEPESYSLSENMDILKEEKNILAIEFHNVSTTSSDMTGIPILMLGYNEIIDGLLYQNPFLNIEDVYPHSNFKIKSDGEALFLTDSDGNIVDKINNIQLPTDFSYGRIQNEQDLYGYFESPTPGFPNGTEYSTDYITDSVTILSDEQTFPGFMRVFIEAEVGGSEIRYTLDGKEPGKNSKVYKGYLGLGSTTVVKARIFRSNSLPGPVTTRTFFVDTEHDLPIISVSMNPFDLWDENNGVYAMGPNANQEEPHFGANFWQDWEKPVHFEIFNTEGDLLFSQDAGTKIFGGWSRANPQKSMSFFARSEYGDGNFSYPLFKERDFSEYEAFILRNSGNDWSNGMFRDAFSASLSAKMGVDHQAYQPYIMYLNGEYWGIINMREKVNEHFIASNHKVNAEDVNILQGNRNVVHGNADSYNRLMDYVTSNDLSKWYLYPEVEKMMDIENFISFWVLNVYIDNKDWPGNNIKFWSLNAPGSKYRWISYDTDFGYSIWDNLSYQYNTLEFSFSEGDVHNWANQLWATELMRHLLSNNSFKNQLINEFADRMNTTFSPEEAIPVIDSFQARLITEAEAHYDRWLPNENWRTYDNWFRSIDRMREYFRKRPYYMRKYIMDRFNISDTLFLSLDVKDQVGGHIMINNTELEKFPFTGLYFKDIPVRIRAIPAPGYRFSHWEGVQAGDSSFFGYEMSASADFTAVFEETNEEPDIVINEINYASGEQMNTEDWIELYNNSNTPVDLTGWAISDGFSQDSFLFKPKTIIGAGEFLLIARSLPDFKRFFPEHKPALGNFKFGLDSSEDGVALYDQDGQLHDYVIYKSLSPWPVEPNGTGATLELINPLFDNSIAGNWKASEVDAGTPLAVNSTFDTVVNSYELAKTGLQMIKAYPSPFSESTNISMALADDEEIAVKIFDIRGNLVHHVPVRKYGAGRHTLQWIPDEGATPGIYIVQVYGEHFKEVIRLIYRY